MCIKKSIVLLSLLCLAATLAQGQERKTSRIESDFGFTTFDGFNGFSHATRYTWQVGKCFDLTVGLSSYIVMSAKETAPRFNNGLAAYGLVAGVNHDFRLCDDRCHLSATLLAGADFVLGELAGYHSYGTIIILQPRADLRLALAYSCSDVCAFGPYVSAGVGYMYKFSLNAGLSMEFNLTTKSARRD